MGLAQEVAYSSLLAFFPAVIALIGLLDLINAYGALQSFLDPVAPKAVTQLIDSFKRDSGGSGSIVALVLGSTLAVWAASGAMGSVVKAVNRTYDRRETRPFWKVKLISILLVLVSALVTAGDAAPDRARRDARRCDLAANAQRRVHVGVEPPALADRVRRGARALRVDLLLRAEHRGAPLALGDGGAVVGAVMWLALSGLFALYTSFSNSYTKTYGTLAGGIILLLWLNYSAWAILFGAELNAQLDRQADHRDAGGDQ